MTDTQAHAAAVNAGPGLEFCPLMANYGAPTLTFVRGLGTEVFDVDDKRYLDFLGGLAVTSLGHSNPAVADAIAAQAHLLTHVSNLYNTIPGPEVALALDQLMQSFPARGDIPAEAPTRQLGQVVFQNSGAEANEAAIKLARKYNGRGRHVVLSALRSFHGRSLATLHATGQPEKHEPFQPLPEGFRHAAFDDVDAMEAALDDTVGAILIEAIQAEGGVNTPRPGYLRDLRALCDDRQLLLIVDEIQTGMARTGAWFAFQHEGIQPDIVTMAKGLGNGMPIGAMWARREVAAAFKPGDHGSTFGGQPLAAAAARAVIAEMARIDAPRLATEKGARLTDALLALEGVSAVRGAGLLLGVELNELGLAGRTGPEISALCGTEGLLVNGITPTALRLAPPLTASLVEIDEAVQIIDRVLKAGS